MRTQTGVRQFTDVDLVLDAAAALGEGATWDPARARLIWIDIIPGRVHLFNPADGSDRHVDVGQPVGAAVTCSDGRLLLALRDGFARLDPDSGALDVIARVEADRPDTRMNDGGCDAAGRFWAGTMAMDARPGQGTLYRLDPDGRVHTMVTPVGISNGLDWSLDGRTMYYIDSLASRIDRFDFDPAAGSIANRREFVIIDPADGLPDGLTVDAEGGIWVALWAGGAVRRYLPDGSLDRVVRLPVTHPTTCAFGGPDLGDLYITSATCELSDEERRRQPSAGGLFRHRPGVAGRPAHAFRG
jgi:sugar lactone lactonase YvrE